MGQVVHSFKHLWGAYYVPRAHCLETRDVAGATGTKLSALLSSYISGC